MSWDARSMQATAEAGQALAEPRPITGAFGFEQDLEIFAASLCLAKCPSCAHGACSNDEGHSGSHHCNYCGTGF